MALLVCGMLSAEWLCRKSSFADKLFAAPAAIRWTVALALLFLLILFGKYNESPAFIYFQF